MKLIDKILEVLYPSRCACCGDLNGKGFLCNDCENAILEQRIIGKLCRHCGHEKHNCQCNKYHYLFEGICAPFYNRNAAQQGVYMFKFQNAPYCADYFGNQMAETIRLRFKDIAFDTVCFVPSTKKSLRSRKYDYVELLAKKVSKELKLPLSSKLLKKTRDTEKQHTLTSEKRQSNVKGAYKATKRIDGQTVLLIDDIKTTGYTLNECAKQLRIAGADKVYCATALLSANISCNGSKNRI